MDEVHLKVKEEEWGEYTFPDKKDYKLFRVYILKFEEQISRAFADLSV